MKDYEIIELFWNRSERAIAETAKKYGNYCYSISYNILQNIEEAQECVNDAYLRAWNSIPPKRPNNLGTYLGKIIRNVSLNRYKYFHTEKRGAGQTQVALDELEECIPSIGIGSVEQSVEEKELIKILENFLWDQREQKRNIFVRRYWYLQSIKEIAEAYSMREGKVATILHRMRVELKIYLEKEGIFL